MNHVLRFFFLPDILLPLQFQLDPSPTLRALEAGPCLQSVLHVPADEPRHAEAAVHLNPPPSVYAAGAMFDSELNCYLANK